MVRRGEEAEAVKILIVDDSKAMRLIVRRTLRAAGFGEHDFEEAVNGADALGKIKAEAPDLVLSDWNMPEMTGIELLEALNQESIKVRFGFVTSEGTPEMRSRASSEGALFLIAKPFKAETFQEKLTPVLAE
jgi:two-component system chemotaxis response regulator CheY